MSTEVDYDDEPATEELIRDKKPVHLNEILKLAKDRVVITESLKKAIIEVSDAFGMDVIKSDSTAEAVLRSKHLMDHVGRNEGRLIRKKVAMQRPKEVPMVNHLLKKYGAKERKLIRDANRKAAISVSNRLICMPCIILICLSCTVIISIRAEPGVHREGTAAIDDDDSSEPQGSNAEAHCHYIRQ